MNGANVFSELGRKLLPKAKSSYTHTRFWLIQSINIMFECIRSSIIQCVQLKSHAIYLIFRCFAQNTISRSPFFKSISCSDLIMQQYTTPLECIDKHTHTQMRRARDRESEKCRCVTSLFCTLLTISKRPFLLHLCECSVHFCAFSLYFQYSSNYSG